jgi:hypothetical protein
MGVRVYTRDMPITSENTLVLGRSARVVIDCTAMFAASAADAEAQVASLLRWVSIYAERSRLEIVLGGYRNHKPAHTLQSRLQALGCTVIARHSARMQG